VAPRKAFLLRLDPAVHDALASWAADELRSLNGHVEFLLRDALRRAGRRVPQAPSAGAAPGEAASGEATTPDDVAPPDAAADDDLTQADGF
jgi:hypothetical protein